MKSMDQWRALLAHAREKTPRPTGDLRDFATLRALVKAWSNARNPRERAVRGEQVAAFGLALDGVKPLEVTPGGMYAAKRAKP